jgi:NAD-dependent dihydropyrimidine dehydrogenase PreA subunit
MLRKIVSIDEALCDGCGDCVPTCHEGALQIIDGKARLISDLVCDGLGACLGHCPQGAITIDVREAEPYNEAKVMETIVNGGPNVIKAHLEHLIDHNEMEYFQEAITFLTANGIDNPVNQNNQRQHHHGSGCPGSRAISFDVQEKPEIETGSRQSQLRQWPVQLHLVSPSANYFQNSDLLLAADCCAFAYADFHRDFMNGRSLAIACPKLDGNQEVYFDKLVTMINKSNLKSITVLVMQVPCCSGLYQLATEAIKESGKDIPLKVVVIGVNGDILKVVQVS